MMAKMSGLAANGLPPMAVGAPNFALVDLCSEGRQGMLIEGERDHAFASFRAYVVEFQDHDVRLPAPDARCVLKVIQEITEVPSLNGPVGGHARLKVHAPGSACTQAGAAAMAIRTDDLTARHFGLNPRKRIALVYQRGDRGRLLCNVVELQDERVCEPAVRAARRGKQAEHVLPCLSSSAFPCRAGLLAVQISALADVVGPAPLAPRLLLVEVGKRQTLFATPTVPPLDSPGWRRRLRQGGRLRRPDAPSPEARRAERDSQLACDRPQRSPLRAKSSGLPLLGVFPGRHTNIRSHQRRTD
jgi:hypothetical protein